MSAERWEFYLDARGLWCWRRIGATAGTVSDSKRCFPTRSECIADAEKHGFVDRPARRRTKGVKVAKVRVPPSNGGRRAAADPH